MGRNPLGSVSGRNRAGGLPSSKEEWGMKYDLRTTASTSPLREQMRGSSLQAKVFLFTALFVITLFLGILSAEAAPIYYVRAGATGNGSGSDWTNAYTSLPASLVRGATYYIADGSYAGYVFDDAQSGSTYIYIKKATASDHGTDTGWSSSYGDGQAEFSPVSFSSGYYEIDGQTGGGNGSWDSGYGIRIRTTSNATAKLVKFNTAVTNITFRHIDFSFDYNDNLTFPAGSQVAVSQDAIYGTNSASNITFSYCRFNRAGRTAFLTRAAWNNIIIEHTYFKDCTIGTTASNHGEIWSANHGVNGLTNVTFRYNYVRNFTSTGGLILSGGNGIDIYGNIFQSTVIGSKANGVIANWTAEPVTVNVRIYNNTFVDTDARIGFGNTSDWVAYNNLFYSNTYVGFTNTTHDYNRSDVNLSEPNGEVNAADPFTNRAGNNFTLSAATKPGTNLSNVFTKDMNNNTMGADGTWDRGAFEFTSGANPKRPSPPLNLSATAQAAP